MNLDMFWKILTHFESILNYFWNILQYTNSRNLSIFSCITSRASTVDSFTTLSILTQISSTQKFQKTRPKSFKSPSQNAFSKRPKRLSNPNWAQASQPAYPPKSGPLAQRTKNNSSNSNSYLTFPPKTAKTKDKGDLLLWFKVQSLEFRV